VSYLFHDINKKSNPVTSLAPYTDEEIVERISASTSSYMIEFNEDTFKPDTVFESFHHQAQIPKSDRALLANFLMLLLKHCVVPKLPHEVIVADVVYLAVLLARGKSISLLQAMITGIQSGLRVLIKSLCQVKAVVDSQGRQVVDSEGRPEVKTPNLRGWRLLYIPDGLIYYALPVTDDGGVSLRRLRPFYSEAGEFKLVKYYMYYVRKLF